LKKLKDRKVLRRIREVIRVVEDADDLQSIPNVKKLAGAANAYRVRVGRYRIGFFLEPGEVVFVRCLPRRNLYRFFPVATRY